MVRTEAAESVPLGALSGSSKPPTAAEIAQAEKESIALRRKAMEDQRSQGVLLIMVAFFVGIIAWRRGHEPPQGLHSIARLLGSPFGLLKDGMPTFIESRAYWRDVFRGVAESLPFVGGGSGSEL